MVGIYLGGWAASRWVAENERLQLLAVAFVNCVPGLLLALVYLVHSYVEGFVFLGLANVAFGIVCAPLFAALQTVVPSRLRGMSVMIVLFFSNLIGSGLGPVVVGVLSEGSRPVFGTESLRYALFAMSPWFFCGSWYAWQASKSVKRDVESIRENMDYSRFAYMLAFSVSHES